MARDRKRTKQRQQRRAQRGAPAPAPPHGQVERADLPGSLEHVGDVDEFDAALIRGAGGVPVSPEAAPEIPAGAGRDGEDGANGNVSEADLARIDADAGSGGGARRGNGGALQPASDGDGVEGAHPDVPHERRQSLPRRVIGFLRASWAELQRVQWPDRRQVSQATAVVLGFVAVAGLYLGAADWVAQKIVNFIL